MNELKEIEEWYDVAEQLTKDSQDYFNTDVMVRYIYSYYKWSLSDLLEKEYAETDDEAVNDKIMNLILLASAKTCKTLSEELSLKYIRSNVETINHILTKTQLSEHAIIVNNDDIVQSFYDTESMLKNLTFEKQPIEAFQRFLQIYNIKLKTKNSSNHIFEFTFKDKELKKHGSYECNTIFEFLDYCSPFLLDRVNKEVLSDIKYSPNVIKTRPYESFDFNIAKKLKNNELYEYLYRFEYIRMNFLLEDLFLLLYYDKIDEFKNKALMEQLKNALDQSRLS